jgi:hypothetical protein
MKKDKQEDPMVFALTTETHLINKFPKDDEGNIINTEFNARTYTKKAHKAFLKGQNFFKYKGVTYVVPKMQKSKLESYLEGDLEDQITEESVESKLEKNKELW